MNLIDTVEGGTEAATVLARAASPLFDPAVQATSIAGVAVARFAGFDLQDRALVTDLPQRAGEIVAARSTVPLRLAMIGAQAVVMFDEGDPARPLILGLIQDHGEARAPARPPPQQWVAEADGERCLISAERDIVLRCGDASITLTRAGKVIIRGNYIISRSSGCNKIKGAAVEIN
jgi:hypothetical protein